MKTKHQDIFCQKSKISPFPSMNVFLSRTSLEDSSHSTPSPLSSAASSQVRNQNREMLQLPQLSKIINFEFDRIQSSIHTGQLLNSNQFNEKYFRTPFTRPSCWHRSERLRQRLRQRRKGSSLLLEGGISWIISRRQLW